jgi:hypothetical protein
MVLRMRPSRGGFLRPFGCGWFIREFLLGNGPYGSPDIEPDTGAPQADIFYYYKNALRYVSAGDRAVKAEEKKAKKEKRSIDPSNIETLTNYSRDILSECWGRLKQNSRKQYCLIKEELVTSSDELIKLVYIVTKLELGKIYGERDSGTTDWFTLATEKASHNHICRCDAGYVFRFT